MSEIKTVNVQITNLDALKSAASALGGTVAVASTFRAWYPNQKCDYKITLKERKFEVGICREKDGTFSLRYDDLAENVEQAFGKGLHKLKQQYAKHNTIASYRKFGFLIHEVAGKNGKLKLEAQRI